MEICEELRYNFDAENFWKVKIEKEYWYDI